MRRMLCTFMNSITDIASHRHCQPLLFRACCATKMSNMSSHRFLWCANIAVADDKPTVERFTFKGTELLDIELLAIEALEGDASGC